MRRAHAITLALYYLDELTTDLRASIDEPLDDVTDPATIICTVNPDTEHGIRAGDFLDAAAGTAATSYRQWK